QRSESQDPADTSHTPPHPRSANQPRSHTPACPQRSTSPEPSCPPASAETTPTSAADPSSTPARHASDPTSADTWPPESEHAHGEPPTAPCPGTDSGTS